MARSGWDRYFYLIMALFYAAAAVIGFAPNSLAILAGSKPNPPLLIHVHAFIMSSWMALLVAQASLMATGHASRHMQLGLISLLLAPLIVIVMSMIAWPYLKAPLSEPAITLIQIKRIALFSIFFGLAFLWRKRHSEAHKRLLFLATFVVLDAAFFRMDWFLPNFGNSNTITVGHICQLVLLIPLVIYDAAQRGRVHIVYIIGIPIIIGFQVAAALS